MKTRRLFFFSLIAIVLIAMAGTPTNSQFVQTNGDEEGLIAGRNVNMLSGYDPDKNNEPYDINGQRQNEPSIAVSTRNPLHLIAGANDWQPLDMDIVGEELPGVHQNLTADDAWMGVFTSTDGGESWKNRLLPGSLVDNSPESLASPIYGYHAAADPVWRAGAAGMLFGTGITFNRGQRGLGALFVARYIDRNNREGGDPIQYIDTKVIDIGNAGHFIDKCWLAVDVPRPTGVTTMGTVTLPNGDIVPRMNVFVVYTSFMGDSEEDVHGKLMLSVSHDSGETWSNPSQITDAGQPYQAATLAIDPRNGRLHVAWRRFAKDEHTDAIMMLSEKTPKDAEEVGYTHEKLKFLKPIVVQEIAPFDQPNEPTFFRTNTYPTMTIDPNGIVYFAYAMRNEFDYSRIFIKMWDPDNDLWYGPTEICLADDLPVDPNDPLGIRLSHMFKPTIRYGAGKITLAWYDQRWDISTVFSYYINDAFPLNWRHTIDVRAAQSDPFPNLDFSESIQVSKYPWLLLSDTPGGPPTGAMQLQHFFPGLEIFQQGTQAFIGDYIDLAPSPPFIPDGQGGWSYNTGVQSPGFQNTRIQTEVPDNPVFHVVWADNRDIDATADLLGFNPPGVGCNPDRTRSRDQNIYTSRLTRGIIAGSPGNSKQLSIKRAFVVFVKNTTALEKNVDLTLTSHDGATVKFVERGVEYDELTDVAIPPYSTTSRTVSVDTDGGLHASATINVLDSETGMLLAQVTLNSDPTNPDFEGPDGIIIDDTETHTPHVGAYHVIEWNYELANPHVGAPHVGAAPPGDGEPNDDVVTPHVGAPHVGAPHVGAPHVGAPHVGAASIYAPHVGAASIDYENIPDNSSMTDVYVGVENVGNTTSSYSISTLPVEIPGGILVQLLVYRVHITPSADGCDPIFEEHHELISSVTPHVGATPVGGNSLASIQYIDLPVDVNVPVEAGGRIVVCYRILDPDKYDNIKVEPTSFVPVIQQDVKDIIGGVEQTNDPPPALAVTTTSLNNGYVGLPYSQTLEADGGFTPYSWNLEVAPTWMDIDPNTGEIYGTPSDAGTDIQVTISVTDNPPSGITQQTSYKTFYIDVLSIVTLSVDPNPIAGGSVVKNPDKANYTVGENVELSANANAGYTFSGWSGDVPAGHEMDNPLALVMDTNKVLAANFTALPIGDGSLVSWWRGENNAYDIVGGNHGTLHGSGTTYSTGIVNQAFDFAGTDDYITAPGTNIDNLLEFTVECWIKASSYPSHSDPIPGSVFVELYGEKAVLRYDGWSEGLGYQYLHFYMRDGDNNLHHVWVDSVLQTGCFHHVVGTYDGEIMRLYLDGYEVGQNPTPSIYIDGSGVSLGGQAHLNGLLDEVRIYNRALLPEEIRNNYLIPADPGKCPHTEVLIDGVMSPGEWDSAAEIVFDVNLPPYGIPGGTTPGTLFVMNDDKNLYLAVRYPQSIGDIGESLTFEFDNNGNEGPSENGDDAIGINPGFFTDSFRTNEPPCEPGHIPGYCAPRDVHPDLDPPGDNDGMGAFGHDGTYTVYETSHPLNSQDSSHDFSLSPGDLLGIRFDLHIVTGPGDSHDVTTFPAGGWLVIYISNPAGSEMYEFVDEWGSVGSGDYQFDNPLKVSVDNSAEFVYVADDYNHRIQKYTTDGTLITKWGSFSSDGSGDYEFAYPVSVAVDPTGQYVYVVDAGHDRIKKFTSDGTIVGWWGLDNDGYTGWHGPGSGKRGETGSGDGQFYSPCGIAVDSDGNVYVAEYWNFRIQKFTSTGTFITKWGSQGTGDGQFDSLGGLAVDDVGNVYAVESGNDRVQKFTSNGTFLGWWGLDDLGYTCWHDPGSGRTAVEGSGDGQLYNPNRIGIDRNRCVYVSEGSGNRIQKFTSTGTFITKWGAYGSGAGQFQFPYGMAIDIDDYVYVADRYNGRIQKFRKQQ